MSKIWNTERIKGATLGLTSATYEAVNLTAEQELIKQSFPHIFKFEAISIGDGKGQLFLVPLDESSKENAEYILRAIAAYKGE